MTSTVRFSLSSRWLRITQIVAILVFLLAVGFSLAGIPARRMELSFGKENFHPLVSGDFVVGFTLSLEIFMAGVFFCSALVIAWNKPSEPLPIFLAASLAALGATETGMSDAFINPQFNPAGPAWHAPVFALRSFAMGAGLILLYVFPDGRFTPRWTRPLALVWGTLNILWFFFPHIPFNPNDGPTWRATPVASLVFGISWFGSGVLAQALRSRQSLDPIQAQQTKWSAYGLTAAVMGGAIYYGYAALKDSIPIIIEGSLMGTMYQVVRPAVQVMGMSLLPVCLGIAILRYRLFDIDLIISRTLIYTTLTGFLIGIFLLIAGSVSGLFESEGNLFASLLAAGVVAILFQPLREVLQRRFNRLIFGDRDDPYQLLSRLGQKLENTLAPQTTLVAIVDTIGRGLKLPYAAIAVQRESGWQLEAEYFPAKKSLVSPEPSIEPHLNADKIENWKETIVPVTHQGITVGKLLLSQRTPGEDFTRSDLRILEDLARQAGIAVHAIQLQEDLQLARQRLVSTREEERRRLRRDLHDSLGPALASLTLQVDAARNFVQRDPGQAEALLDNIACQTQEAVENIRQLVYGLRPPALDELGLASALHEKIYQHQNSGMQVTFDIPESLPPLPAAVEVATYYIIREAFTNVVRHANARRCLIQLELEPGWLVIRVEDDGRGVSNHPHIGAGMHTMRERAVELGGSFEFQSGDEKGVCLEVRLPLTYATGKPLSGESSDENLHPPTVADQPVGLNSQVAPIKQGEK